MTAFFPRLAKCVGTPFRGRPLTIHKLWTLVPFLVATAPSLLAGCAAATNEEETDTTAQELASNERIQAIDFGSTRRWVKVVASRFCDGWKVTHPKPGLTAKACNHYGLDFQNPVEVELFKDEASIATDTPFPAYTAATWEYEGCGPQAVMNVLNYYGQEYSIDYIHSNAVPTISVPFSDSLASAPNTVAAGLRKILGYTPGSHPVNIGTMTDVRGTVRQELLRGNPVIVLVHGGSHYQVVTGLNANVYHVIDYANNDAWVAEDQLGLELGFPAAWGSLFSNGSGGYEDDTVVTADYHSPSPLIWPTRIP